MKKKMISIILCVLMCATIASVAGASKNDTFSAATHNPTHGTWITSGTNPQPAGTWFRYDDGSCENSLGLTAGGTLYEVIKLTPTELGSFTNSGFFAIKVMHGCPAYPGCPETPWTAWIYYGASHPNNPETDATIIATGDCPAQDDYYYVNFTSPYAFNTTDNVWLGIGWTHPAGSYPCGFDTDSCVSGKSDYLWFPGGQWYELGGIGYPGNWNFEVLIDTVTPDTTAPTTTCTVSGTNPVTLTLTATDPDDAVAATFYKLDGATDYTQYTVPVQVTASGAHTITFYSVDSHGNQETPQTKDFTVAGALTITIKGGIGITATVHNDGSADVPVTGTITVTGLVFPKSKAVSGTVPAGGDLKLKDMVFGFGKTTVTVTLGDNTASADHTVLLFLVL